jgi:hypothetical protein
MGKRVVIGFLVLVLIVLSPTSATVRAVNHTYKADSFLQELESGENEGENTVLSRVGRLTYYAAPFEGRRHACAHDLPAGFTSTAVFEDQPGLATGDRSIPCGTVVLLEVVGIPTWAEGRYDDVIGRKAVGVVVDRLGAPSPHTYDAYPNLFRDLVGPPWDSLGRVYVRAELIGHLATR